MKHLGYFFYILILGLWTGGVFIYTFVVTPILFKTYGRDKAGDIVGSLFPAYFIFTIAISVLAMLFLFAACSEMTKTAFKVSVGLAVLAFSIAIYVRVSLYPKILDVKRGVPSFEITAVDDPLRVKFRRLHAVSAVLNLVFLADGTVLMAIGTILRR